MPDMEALDHGFEEKGYLTFLEDDRAFSLMITLLPEGQDRTSLSFSEDME